MTNLLNRRQWIGATAASLSVPSFFPSSATAQSAQNDRPIAAVIGAGGRGTSMAWHQFGRSANLVAICDVDLPEAERAAATIEAKIGVRPDVYQDYRKLLERDDIEVVGNATPDHWHTKINIIASTISMSLLRI
ncbi:Gfo/Idh/MocA family oxidoreductase [Novipirellula artificiosorum]|uniref:Oxidoreductase family, NAD-binding Rossmann fold n=1 Tax=Novipirellula artificiosorum TaxID=2528016 RepID=A0A5C6D8R6_9BACT|nr:Gfo/Idh/MocA family oxidoreductase [Novipirellula artificiosorum]TWU32181.1 Oxidoreductase family, NAD-binding Rossmann fold [Novipirellula artificiosorum]